MATFTHVLFLLLVAVFTSQTFAENVRVAHQSRLLDDLFGSYDRRVRPGDENDRVDVDFGANVADLTEVDEVKGYIRLTLWYKMMWKDFRLVWAPEDYGEIKSVQIPVANIWIPDIYPMSLYKSESIPEEHPEYGMLAVLSYDGTIYYIPRKSLAFRCDFDVEHFPFDSQNCTIKFMSWVHNADQIKFKIENADMSPSSIAKTHVDWEVTSLMLNTTNTWYPCCPEPYQSMEVHLSMTRKPDFYILFYISPAVLLSIVLPIVHLFPPESSQKTTLVGFYLIGVMIMIAMIENQLRFFAEEKTPHLLKGYEGMLFFGIFSIFINSITASLAQASHRTCRIAWPIRKMLTVIGCDSCGRCTMRDDFSLIQTSDEDIFKYHPQNDHDQTPIVSSTDDSATRIESDDLVKTLQSVLKIMKMRNARRMLEREWFTLAVVLDRLTAIFYVLYFIINMIVLMR